MEFLPQYNDNLQKLLKKIDIVSINIIYDITFHYRYIVLCAMINQVKYFDVSKSYYLRSKCKCVNFCIKIIQNIEF